MLKSLKLGFQPGQLVVEMGPVGLVKTLYACDYCCCLIDTSLARHSANVSMQGRRRH